MYFRHSVVIFKQALPCYSCFFILYFIIDVIYKKSELVHKFAGVLDAKINFSNSFSIFQQQKPPLLKIHSGTLYSCL